jgi:hypothetical protein
LPNALKIDLVINVNTDSELLTANLSAVWVWIITPKLVSNLSKLFNKAWANVVVP